MKASDEGLVVLVGRGKDVREDFVRWCTMAVVEGVALNSCRNKILSILKRD